MAAEMTFSSPSPVRAGASAHRARRGERMRWLRTSSNMLPRVSRTPVGVLFPRRIRWHLGNDPDLMASTLNIFLRALELLKGASVQARLPLPHGEASWAPPRKRRCATQDGFSLHANVRVRANDRQGLEELCLYAARGAISLERLEQRPDGKLSYRMRRPAPDDSTHLVLTPLALLKKLAALIPPPRVHHVRFHGVFGPAARLRPSVTALSKPQLPSVQEPQPEVGPTTSASSIRQSSRLD